MIHDVADTLQTEADDGSTGINARISTLNSEESLSGANVLPSLNTIQVLGPTDGTEAKLPGEFAEADLPALVAEVVSAEMELENQGVRRAQVRVAFYYLDHEPDQNRARKFVGYMQKVLVRWLEDSVISTGTIANVTDVNYEPRRWLLAGSGTDIERAFLSCNVVERDPNP